jgi:ubiquinone biosynthesis monooxygenase Coq6
MGAIDKLHKLYSTTFEPLVWARSVGVEVLNELDSVKTALMMTAGAQRRTNDRGRAWSLTAKGVETLATSVHTAKAVGDGLGRTLRTALHEILRATTPKENK